MRRILFLHKSKSFVFKSLEWIKSNLLKADDKLILIGLESDDMFFMPSTCSNSISMICNIMNGRRREKNYFVYESALSNIENEKELIIIRENETRKIINILRKHEVDIFVMGSGFLRRTKHRTIFSKICEEIKAAVIIIP